MTRRWSRLLRLGVIVLAVTLATIALGWIGPIFVGLVIVAIDGRDSTPDESALGAAISWTLILLLTALSSGARPVSMIGAALGVPAIALPLASILFAAALAWSSATVTLLVRQIVLRDRRAPASAGGNG